jgi:hypothetical protein
MKNGINLVLTNSIFEFDQLLERAVETVQLKNLSVANNIHRINALKFCVGKYVQIKYDKEDEDKYDRPDDFWIGFAWQRKNKQKFCILLEFDEICALGSPCKYSTGAEKLVGTSGKYYSKVENEYSHTHINSWIRFYLKNKYFKQFYDENIGRDAQLEILTGFISEVLENCEKKYEQKENCSASDLSKEIDLFMKDLHENLIKHKHKKNFSRNDVFHGFEDIFGGNFFKRSSDKGK